MKLISKINYDEVVGNLFFIYICSFYAFPYQMLEVELISLVLLLPRLKKIKVNIFLGWSIAYIAILSFSTIYSIEPAHSLIKVLQILKSLIFANILISAINSRERLENIFKSLITAGIVLIGRILLIFPINELGKSRIHIENLFNANGIGFKLSISLLLALYFIFFKKNKSVYFIIEAIVIYIFIIFTGSRTAFVFASFEIFLLILLSRKNKISLVLYFFIFSVVLFVFFDEIIKIPIIYNVLGQRIESLLNVFSGKGKVDESSIIRINMIKDGIMYILEKPFLGYGIDAYSFLSTYGTYSHNNYIEMLTGIGFFGTLVYYFIYIFIFVKGIAKKNKKTLLFSFLIFISLIVDLGTVSYHERFNIFILAFSFLGVTILK